MTYEEILAENKKLKEEIAKRDTQIEEKDIQIQEKEVQINKKAKEIEKLQIKVENQELQINLLKRYVFGPKREHTPKEENIVEGTQCSIFGGLEDKELSTQIEKKTEEFIVHKKKKAKTKKSGIKKSELKNVEQETIVCDIKEDTKCPECGADLKKIGTEVVRQEIEYIPAKLKIKTFVRSVYKCEQCGSEESEKETATIVKAKTPKALLPGSFASAELAAEVIYEKYYMGVPLYRQEKAWDDRGLILPRYMSANWCIKLSQYYLEPIYEVLLKYLKEENKVLHGDETKMQCNKEPGRKASSNSYMWVVVSGESEKKKGVIFKYSESRAKTVAEELYKGYKGILVTDGYSAYNDLEGVNRAECWAHARRYFYDSVPLDEHKKMITTSDGYIGAKFIDKLFKIEEKIANLSNEEKVAIRREKSEPILKEFYDWVYLTSEKYITNNKLQEALTYAKNQRANLCKFVEDGKIPLTNSRAERAIRPFAVHRKNWLFADTIDGAKANAVYYSLIESAKANNLNIYKYIKYLLKELSQCETAQTEEQLKKYLPWSEELPEEIRNFQGEYKDLELA